MEARAFEVAGYEGRPLPLVAYEAGAERAAVILPGNASHGYRLGGSPARPDLSFTRALLIEHGYDVVEVWWKGDERPEADDAWYRDNALAAVAAAGEGRVRLVVGRSMGTIALSLLLRELGGLTSMWIAPLTYLAPVREALLWWPGPKLVVAGEADSAFEPVEGVATVLVPGGDHALTAGGAPASARALANALDAMDTWLRRVGDSG